MTLSQIFSLLKEYIFLALFFIIAFLLIFFISYFLIYKKLMKGPKKINFKKLALFSIFAIYIIIVLCATFSNRSTSYTGSMHLSLFSSYKEAYISGTSSNWMNIILNILLFVPMGFFLPLFNPKLKRWYISVGIGFAVTLIIECIQFFTRNGHF